MLRHRCIQHLSIHTSAACSYLYLKCAACDIQLDSQYHVCVATWLVVYSKQLASRRCMDESGARAVACSCASPGVEGQLTAKFSSLQALPCTHAEPDQACVTGAPRPPCTTCANEQLHMPLPAGQHAAVKAAVSRRRNMMQASASRPERPMHAQINLSHGTQTEA